MGFMRMCNVVITYVTIETLMSVYSVAMGPAHVGTSIGDCLNLLYKHFQGSISIQNFVYIRFTMEVSVAPQDAFLCKHLSKHPNLYSK